MKHLIFAALMVVVQTATAQFVTQKVPWSQWGHQATAIVHVPQEAKDSTHKKYPTIIFFHGVGEAGTDINKLYNTGLPKLIKDGLKPEATNPITGILEKFIVIAAQDRYWSPAPDGMKIALDFLIKNYPIDTNMISATGLSAGGMQAIQFACWDSTFAKRITSVVAASPAAIETQALKNLPLFAKYNIPLQIYVGDADNTGPFLTSSKIYTEAVKAAGGIANMQVFRGGHCCWDNIYNRTVKFPWNGVQLDFYEYALVHSKLPSPIITPVLKYIKILHDPAKVMKIIVLDKDGAWTEYTDSSIISGEVKISTK